MYDTILVPTDGSGSARRAAAHAAALARCFDATVHVLSVVDVAAAAGPFDAGGVDEGYVQRLEDAATEAVEPIASQIEGAGDVVTAVGRGDPAETVVEYVDDHDVEFVAMGTHGRSGLRRFFLGSVAESVLRGVEVPVLVDRAPDREEAIDGDRDEASGGEREATDGDRSPAPDEGWPDDVEGYDEVLVPTDGSDAAEAAADHGIAIAREAGARVHAVHVVDVGAVSTQPTVSPPTTLIDSLRKRGEEATDGVARQARDADLEAVSRVVEGFPARDLLRYADERDVDLVAMGTHGRSGLDRLLLGSTTERLIRRGSAPVVAVHPEQAAGE